MDIITDFPVAGKIKFLLGDITVYEGIVACHISYKDSLPMIRIEQANREQLTFSFFRKLNGKEGWILTPNVIPKGYGVGQEAILLHPIME